jgi:hypothetical protein
LGDAVDADASAPHGARGGRALEGLHLAEVTEGVVHSKDCTSQR